ncbi:hypothetical protein GIB67_039767 [Kingdonia uniflora]|uniref:Uncharacterized protein n=1 Tax=Kingdonia uniflora TaxID=39325 RepID=A0A7J7MQ45_9MAGN|nr:hypothetical protein GIB67_039767 [Kingdonia uniflora]
MFSKGVIIYVDKLGQCIPIRNVLQTLWIWFITYSREDDIIAREATHVHIMVEGQDTYKAEMDIGKPQSITKAGVCLNAQIFLNVPICLMRHTTIRKRKRIYLRDNGNLHESSMKLGINKHLDNKTLNRIGCVPMLHGWGTHESPKRVFNAVLFTNEVIEISSSLLSHDSLMGLLLEGLRNGKTRLLRRRISGLLWISIIEVQLLSSNAGG